MLVGQHLLHQPGPQRSLLGDRRRVKAQELPDLASVFLDRAPIPLVGSDDVRRQVQLLGHVLQKGERDLCCAFGKAAFVLEELEQKGLAQVVVGIVAAQETDFRG
jgi:hypothetical protein